VFENQGRYDQAEVMYRKALRLNPRDEVIEQQLASLADRKAGREFQGGGTAQALAMADKLTQPAGSRLSQSAAAGGDQQTISESGQSGVIHLTGSEGTDTSGITTASVTSLTTSGETTDHSLPLPPVDQDGTGSGRIEIHGELTPVDVLNQPVTIADLQIVAESPDQNMDTLLRALENGDCSEAKAYAATLLGECDPQNATVTAALASALISTSDTAVLLAIADSQIQRGEQNKTTAEHLAAIALDASSELRVPATTALRHFAGTSGHEICNTTLISLLSSEEHTVRAAAAATMGDFSPDNEICTAALQELATADSDASVREAARSAIDRRAASQQPPQPIEIVPLP
jgi:tetratricopeptide (TPR) repeat protein